MKDKLSSESLTQRLRWKWVIMWPLSQQILRSSNRTWIPPRTALAHSCCRARKNRYGAFIGICSIRCVALLTVSKVANGCHTLKSLEASISNKRVAAPPSMRSKTPSVVVQSLRPNLSAKAVVDLVKRRCDDTGDKGSDEFTGHGRINFARTMSLVEQ